VAAERGVCLMPSTVARHYPRDGIGYVPVTDADPAVISLAWRPELRRAAIDSFIRIAHEVAAAKSGDRGWLDI
jgi:DNA-binding transcriptional LysR family regulator